MRKSNGGSSSPSKDRGENQKIFELPPPSFFKRDIYSSGGFRKKIRISNHLEGLSNHLEGFLGWSSHPSPIWNAAKRVVSCCHFRGIQDWRVSPMRHKTLVGQAEKWKADIFLGKYQKKSPGLEMTLIHQKLNGTWDQQTPKLRSSY